MRSFRSAAAVCAMLLGALPVVAIAQANINTSRSNTKGVAAPTGDAVTADGSGEEQRAGRKGYEYYQAQSGLAAVVAEPGSPRPTEAVSQDGVARTLDQSQGSGSQASTTVPKQTQGATFGERVNAGLQRGNDTATSNSPAAPRADETPARCQPAMTGAGKVRTSHDAAKNCVANVR